MNYRIKELAKQSGLIQYDTDSKISDAEKFAELIVLDACEAILEWKKEPFPFDESTAVWILKQHFGITTY